MHSVRSRSILLYLVRTGTHVHLTKRILLLLVLICGLGTSPLSAQYFRNSNY